MGIFKKLGDMVFEDDGTTSTQQKPFTNTDNPFQVPQQSTPVASPVTTTPSPNGDKFNQHFVEVLKAANFPGPDYQEFFNSLEMNKGIINDESTLYKVTLNQFITQGLDKKRLIETATAYLQVLENDKTNFQNTVKHEKEVVLVQKKNSLAIVNKEIEALEIQIREKRLSANTLQDEINEKTSSIDTNVNSFLAANAEYVQRIKSDIEKIKSIS